jgi:hypothetical protein
MDQQQGQLARDQWERYIFMRDNGHRAFVDKADLCENFFAGLQWQESDLLALKVVKRPALTINKIIGTLATVFGEQIQNRMEVNFRPAAGAPSENADVLNKVWMHLANDNQLQWVRSDVFADGLIRSRGFYDARICFDDNMRGEIKITKMNSKNVVIDPDAEDYDPDTWNDVILSKWLTPGDVEVLYGKDAADELKARDFQNAYYGYDSLERQRDRIAGAQQLVGDATSISRDQMRYIRILDRQYREAVRAEFFVDPDNGDMREVPSSWDRNRIALVAQKYGLSVIRRLHKVVKWRVTADNLVLHDERSPFKHFTVVPYFPFFRDGKTLGIVEHLLGSQELLNKVTSQELHVINTTANSGWKLKAGALKNMSVEQLQAEGAKTGVVLELDDIKNAEKILPNQIPTGLERMSIKAEEYIRSISLVTDTMQGMDREDVAAKAIGYKTQRGVISFTKVMDNLERTDWILARNVLDMVQEFYTERRVLTITHEGIANEQETITVNDTDPTTGEVVNDLTLGTYDVVVTSAPYRASMEDSQFDQAVALRELGVQIPDEVLIENSRLMRRSEILKNMKAAAESPEAKEAQQLDMRGKRAEVSKLEAEALAKGADADLKTAKAKEAAGADTSGMAELKALEQEHELAMIKLNKEFELKEKQLAAEITLKREMADAELQIKRQAAEDDSMLKRAQAAAAHNQAQQAATQPAKPVATAA